MVYQVGISQRARQELRNGREPKVNPADEQAGRRWISLWLCTGWDVYIQNEMATDTCTAIGAPPSSKWRPSHAAPLQAYEGAKNERNWQGKGDGSVVKWEMNVLKDWSKGILWIPQTGTDCPQQCWMGPARCEGGSNLIIARSNCMGCTDVGIYAHGTLITSLAGPIPCGWQTILKAQMGASVWVRGDSSALCLAHIMLSQV